MNRYVVTSFLLLINSVSFCQDLPKSSTIIPSHAIGLTIGINQVKEENLLARVHTGFITTLSYDYIRVNEQFQNFRFALGFSRIIASPEDFTKSANVMVTSSYSYCFKVLEKNSFNYFIGPRANLAYSVAFYPNWDDSHLYWGNSFSLGINNIGCYAFRDETVILCTFSISLLSLYSRPDVSRLYKIDDTSFGDVVRNLHKNLKFGFINVISSLRFVVEYQFPVFRTKKEAVFYSFDYTHFSEGDALPLTQLIHQIGLRILL